MIGQQQLQIEYFSPFTKISTVMFSSGQVFLQVKKGLLQRVGVWVDIRLLALVCLLFVLEVENLCTMGTYRNRKGTAGGVPDASMYAGRPY